MAPSKTTKPGTTNPLTLAPQGYSQQRDTGPASNGSLAARAQRPVLVARGAALIARDRLVKSAKPYRSPASATAELRKQLRRYEQRGARGRQTLEHRVDRRREQVQRLLRRQHTSEELLNRRP
jgi:hypothetical protein